MGAPLILTLSSGAVALAFVSLLYYERGRGMRIMPTTRAAFDAAVERVLGRFGYRIPTAAFGTIRQSSHYLFHRALTRVLAYLATLEAFLNRLVRSNRRHAARTVRAKHLTELSAHKRASSLSEEEKARRRAEALDGR